MNEKSIFSRLLYVAKCYIMNCITFFVFLLFKVGMADFGIIDIK